MAVKLYNVVFSGKLVEGKEPSDVLASLCPLLKLETDHVRKLFKGGYGTVIVRNLDGPDAYRMQSELREAGVICTVQEIPLQEVQQSLSGAPHVMDAPKPRHGGATPSPTHGYRDSRGSRRNSQGPDFLSLALKLALAVALVWGGWQLYQFFFTVK